MILPRVLTATILRPACVLRSPGSGPPGGGRRRPTPPGARLCFAASLLAAAGAACGGDGAQTADTTGPGSASTTAPTTASATTYPATSAPPVTGGGGRACSADALPPAVSDQPGLPPAVASVRRQIVEAAATCDYDRLGELASAGSRDFSFTFGGGTDPAEHWRRLEAGSDAPLRFLAELLQRPFRRVEGGGPEVFAWPSAFAYGSWDAVPAADREALRPLYDDSDFELFEQFGGYVGHRVGITADGEWLYFVAGD